MKITIRCQFCGKEKIVRADQEFIEDLKNAKEVLCQRRECQEAFPTEVEKGYLRSNHLLGEFWSITRKATVEEQQSNWRAKKILYKGKSHLT
jgi:hypothetical protein